MRKVKKDKLILELCDCADISIKDSTKINEFLNKHYLIKEKKDKSFINKIKSLWEKDNVNYYLEHEEKGRFAFVDVAKAIAMIFIYIGHWVSPNLTLFAYSFHLFLFFMISGFFALHMFKDSFFSFIKKLFLRLILPLFLWACLAFVFSNLDNKLQLKSLSNLFLHTGDIMPNYWFIPALVSTSLYYWILSKSIKKPWIIVIITFILNICFGETGFISVAHISIFDHIPLASWFNFNSFITYGFWYSLGVAIFPLLLKFVSYVESGSKFKRRSIKFICYLSIALSSILLLHSSSFQIIGKYKYVFSIFVIFRAIIIITSVFYFSYLFRESKFLNKVGTHSLVYVGMEFIIHGFIAVTIMQSLNLGVYSFVDSISIITYNLIVIYLVSKVADIVDHYFPILNGKSIKTNQ